MDAPAEDLTELLATGERAVFHGPPGTAVPPLERAVALAQAEGRHPEAAAATWLLGVAHGAGGRYGTALTVLTPLVGQTAGEAGAEARLFGSLAASTSASVSRQLGRHAEARRHDEQALGLADGVGEAEFDARLGLAADAVGLGESDEAATRLEQAGALVPAGDGQEWWRQRVRLSWVQAEVALLTDRPADAVVAAESAVSRAERARAPRHVAKGSLFLGVARLQVGDVATAASTLRRAATLAEGLGALPLVWPSRAVLGAMLAETDPHASAASLDAARAAVGEIAGHLPPGVRAEWLAKPDVAALLEG